MWNKDLKKKIQTKLEFKRRFFYGRWIKTTESNEYSGTHKKESEMQSNSEPICQDLKFNSFMPPMERMYKFYVCLPPLNMHANAQPRFHNGRNRGKLLMGKMHFDKSWAHLRAGNNWKRASEWANGLRAYLTTFNTDRFSLSLDKQIIFCFIS